MTEAIWAVIATGGTAGHVSPGLAIAEEITTRSKDAAAVHFVGSKRGLERSLVAEAGFSLTALSGRGIARKITWRNLVALAGLAVATVRAIAAMARWRPAVVVGMGGYASVPGVVAAIIWRVPLIVAEQNAVPSVTNRFAAKFARAAAVSFDGVDLPRAVRTGNPLRAAITAINRDVARTTARERLGVAPNRKLISVVGGSLGAAKINQTVTDTLPLWQTRQDLTIRHITGKRDHKAIKAKSIAEQTPIVQLIEYETDMATVYAASDLLVCRAGATTVAEITALGVPALLIPLPHAPADHQNANARKLAEVNAAVVLAEHELSPTRLCEEVDKLLNDEQLLTDLSTAALVHGRLDAAKLVVDLLEHHAKRPL